ncbi:single-stranded-DNA-specific exonuclease RecJ [Candidatus Liberibacter africanus]|uniref:Single-stranded-DNA-specific exonuclease RecJ n=1 Tax=Candidatus Liberibacter africanus PTSAPSY TaxID=1277257 RepID=A0A0G3I7E7_LIBAF|nr:single-stranded-DNA-specific exonuclease RecJ [Candidatus Liberibacter africanus]AKK20433.1 single-stranded-DNA-specific exonuclease protein [Candidatus Liberibacter africanus PTSAPSY]QTP64155.1 single-stranded-DNA-specific exonuclease RecJ [Candidatus Liberibacter africanus]
MNDQAFLGVDCSISGFRWVSLLGQEEINRALAITQKHQIPDLVARVLVGRNISIDCAKDFLNPSIRMLMPDPLILTDCDKAARRIVQAIYNSEKIVVFGDYDVDGATSVALMMRFFSYYGVNPDMYIPDRITDGYGPNPALMEKFIDEGAKLIITVDCGSTSHDALQCAANKGIDVVVIDHHQMKNEEIPAYALVNPNRSDDLSGQGHLCAAGVVFLVLVAICRMLRQDNKVNIKHFDLLSVLDLVALATICDVVPLVGLNRAYVLKGLMIARSQGNPGLKSLIERVNISSPITSESLGYTIGPCINAGGRIGDSNLGSRLLISDDLQELEALAMKLDILNQNRRLMESAMLEQAESEVLTQYEDIKKASIIVVAGDKWHPGIVGLLAARLREKFDRPSFAISFESDGKGIGSGRSIEGFDIGKMVFLAVEKGILLKGGGHAMAAGLTVERANFNRLRDFFQQFAQNIVPSLVSTPILKIDGALNASAANIELIDMLESAGPYGAGNPRPVFAFPSHKLRSIRVVKLDHLQMTFESQDSETLQGIAFRVYGTPLGEFLMKSQGNRIHVIGNLYLNYWRGSKRSQLRVLDASPIDNNRFLTK